MSIILAILILSFIIIIHELGHYTVGRLSGIGVEEFSVGMGPKLLQGRRGGILYTLRPILFGGYVRFTGEDEDSVDPRAFNNQKVWKRFLTILAGPGMNFVLAWVMSVVILWGYGLYGQTVPVISEIMAGTPAAESGLQAGDVVLTVDGHPLSYDEQGYYDMVAFINEHDPARPLELEVRRGGETIPLQTGLYQYEDGSYKMGVSIGREHIVYSLGGALGESFTWMREMSVEMLVAIKNLIFHGEGLSDVSGPVGIVREVSSTMSEGLRMALIWIMFISLNLGIMNLLPLPALDGGRLVFLVIEGIRRKPISRDREGLIHFIGLVALMGLLVILTWHDIARIIHG